jgi:ribosome-associated translation inhibitor RaiA
VDDAVSLYLPSAQVHTPTGVVEGRTGLLSILEGIPVSNTGRDPSSVAGEDRHVTVEWLAERDEPGWHTTLLIEHGLIVEQWTVESAEVEEAPAEVHVSTKGPVPDDAPNSFRQHLGAVLDTIDDPVLFVRGKLDLATDPAVAQPARAAITVDVNGSVLRAHGRGASLQEAILEVTHRLRDRLEHRSDRERHRPTGLPAEPGHWHHGNLPTMHPPWFDRPPGEREVVRHKTPAPAELTIDEAAWDMHMLDYDFFIFRELGSGQDTLLWLAPDGLCLQQVGRVADELDLGVTDAKVDSTSAARLSVREAIERLEAIGERFVFFENATTGRGNVLYHRYDGHYGVITQRDRPEPGD